MSFEGNLDATLTIRVPTQYHDTYKKLPLSEKKKVRNAALAAMRPFLDPVERESAQVIARAKATARAQGLPEDYFNI